MHVRIVLPAYNEEGALAALLSRIDAAFRQFQWKGDIVVVNDGSSDATLQIASSFKGAVPVHVVDLQPNRGLAGAMRAGLARGVEGLHDDDVIVTLDADNTHNPFLIQRMLGQIAEGSDIVIASRYQPGARVLGLSFFRVLTSIGAGFLFRVGVGLEGVKDYTCGFRVYRVDVLKKTLMHYGDRFILQKGFGCMAEILIKTAQFSTVISEVPMILRYDFKRGVSKMKVMSTVLQTCRMILDYRLGRGFR